MKHQQEIYYLTTETTKTLNMKVAEYEEKIKTVDQNYKKQIEDLSASINDNNKKIKNLDIQNAQLENNVNELNSETKEKGKKLIFWRRSWMMRRRWRKASRRSMSICRINWKRNLMEKM